MHFLPTYLYFKKKILSGKNVHSVEVSAESLSPFSIEMKQICFCFNWYKQIVFINQLFLIMLASFLTQKAHVQTEFLW